MATDRIDEGRREKGYSVGERERERERERASKGREGKTIDIFPPMIGGCGIPYFFTQTFGTGI